MQRGGPRHLRLPSRHVPARLTTLAFCFFLAACATVKAPDEGAVPYRLQVQRLEAKLVGNPRDAGTLRELGVIYFQVKDYGRAEAYLRRCTAEDPWDGKALFYLGMALESQGKRQDALAQYLKYDEISSTSYRSLMEGRYRQLTRDIIAEEFRTLLVQENAISDRSVSPNTVAVYPLVYQGSDERYAALGKGLSEMIMIDLGNVKSLSLVERIRIEALRAELQFGQSKAVDRATAPRLGKLLKAGRMVTGTYNVSESDFIRLDVAAWDVGKKKYPEGTVKSDAADKLFKLQKDLVFALIEQMGIKLTSAEREKILRVPTQNLQAFFAYSMGLEKEDKGDFRSATALFNQALTLDPNFSPAKSKASEMDALSRGGGKPADALVVAQNIDPPPRPDVTGEGNLVSDRLQKLGDSIGSGFAPGQDSRKPAEEAFGAGAGKLPEPPKPPGK